MSNVREQPDWWLGADGRWHPPDPKGGGTAGVGARCPSGHATRPGAKFCGACGASVEPPASRMPPASRTPARAMRTRPTTALVPIVLGAILVGLAPLLSWVRVPLYADLGLPSTANLFQILRATGSDPRGAQAGPIVVAAASYLVVMAALLVALARPRRAAPAATLAVVTLVLALAATWGAVSFYVSIGATVSNVGSGAWASVLGMALVVLGAIGLAASRARTRARARALPATE
jgi:hypothetical protein